MGLQAFGKHLAVGTLPPVDHHAAGTLLLGEQPVVGTLPPKQQLTVGTPPPEAHLVAGILPLAGLLAVDTLPLKEQLATDQISFKSETHTAPATQVSTLAAARTLHEAARHPPPAAPTLRDRLVADRTPVAAAVTEEHTRVATIVYEALGVDTRHFE